MSRAFQVVAVLAICAGSSAQRPTNADNIARLTQELEEVRRQYDSWSAKLVMQYSPIDNAWGGSLTEILSQDWSSIPKEATSKYAVVRIARSGESYRIEQELIARDDLLRRSSHSWDGKVKRYRDDSRSINGPPGNQRFGVFPNALPHDLVLMRLGANEFVGHPELGLALFYPDQMKHWKGTTVFEESLDDHPCWKIEFHAPEGWVGRYWLSKRHNLLPILTETFHGDSQIASFRIDSFQQILSSDGIQRSFPERCTRALANSGSPVIITGSMEIRGDETTPSVFNSLSLSTPAMLANEVQAIGVNRRPRMARAAPLPTGYKPSPPLLPLISGSLTTIVLSLISLLLLVWVLMRSWRKSSKGPIESWAKLRNITGVAATVSSLVMLSILWHDPSSWHYSATSLAPLLPLAAYLLYKRETTDEESSKPRHRVRTAMGIGGAFVTATVFGALCVVTSWWQQGIAALCAGLVGFAWIALMQCFIRARRISLISILCIMACTAMVMSGYQGGLSRIRARHRMMDALDVGLGEYAYRKSKGMSSRWITTPEGLLIPRRVANAIGRAALGSVEGITVPPEMFTAANLRTWCLDDVRRISFHDPVPASGRFAIPTSSINAIPSDCELDAFEARFGFVDDLGLESLSKFKSISTLALNLSGNTIPGQLQSFDSMNSLQISDAHIENAGVEILARIASLQRIVLIDPTFGAGLHARDRKRVPNFQLHTTVVTPQILQALKNLDQPILRLYHCTFGSKFEEIANDGSLGARRLEAIDTAMTDAVLMSLASSPELKEITLHRTKVTIAGIDRFSASRPDVSVLMD